MKILNEILNIGLLQVLIYITLILVFSTMSIVIMKFSTSLEISKNVLQSLDNEINNLSKILGL